VTRSGPKPPTTATTFADIAADFVAKKTVKADDREFTALGNVDDIDAIRQFAVAYLRHEQDLDLQAFGVRFDHYFLESSLYSSGRVDDAVKRLVASGKTFEDGGALWLRTTDYGDDKDRRHEEVGRHVHLLRARRRLPRQQVRARLREGESTSRAATTTARSRGCGAGVQAAGAGVPEGYPDYVLHKMVTVMKGARRSRSPSAPAAT